MAADEDLRTDPCYMIGRLVQAASMLLNQDVPEPDATGQLLSEAIGDAIKWRQRPCAACGDGDVCEACRPDWHKAALYESLWLQLGLIGRIPHHADLKVVDW